MNGIKKVSALLWCLENQNDRMVSVITQDRFRRGINTNRKIRKPNPASMRLNPKSKSNLAPIKRINGTWVKIIAMPLKIFIFLYFYFELERHIPIILLLGVSSCTCDILSRLQSSVSSLSGPPSLCSYQPWYPAVPSSMQSCQLLNRSMNTKKLNSSLISKLNCPLLSVCVLTSLSNEQISFNGCSMYTAAFSTGFPLR